MLALLTVGAVLLAPAASPARAATAGLPKWSQPMVVDRVGPTADGLPMTGVSCPSVELCVAVDGRGEVLSTSRPTRAAGWLAVPLYVPPDPSVAQALQGGLGAITCPSVHLCVAQGAGHYLFVSKHPRGSAGEWKRIRVGGSHSALDGVSCAGLRLCVAVERDGTAFVSGDPLGGAKTWHPRRVLPVHDSHEVLRVTCPTVSFCAALDDGGEVFTTTHPLWRSASWGRHRVGRSPYRLSCPSSHLCVVIDVGGRVYASKSPGSGGWHRAGTVSTYVTDLTCRSARLCVAVDPSSTGSGSASQVFVSTDPASGTEPWSSTSLPGRDEASAVSCASLRQCVAVTFQGHALTTSRPVNGPWESYRADGINPFTGISCAALSMCVAIDAGGDILTSADSGAGYSSWGGHRLDPGVKLTGISCPGTSTCVAVDQAGAVLSSSDAQFGDPNTWTRVEIDPGHALNAVACPSTSLCLAVDDAGTVFTSTNPTGDAGSWSPALVDPGTGGGAPPALSSVTCASPAFCLVADTASHVFTSTDPNGGAIAWQQSDRPPDERRSPQPRASCASSQLCVVIEGRLWASTDPAGGPSAWQSESSWSAALRAVDCPSTTLCVVSRRLSGSGPGSKLRASAAPAGGAAAWHDAGLDSGGVVVSISCRPGTTRCVAVDDQGGVLSSGHPTYPRR